MVVPLGHCPSSCYRCCNFLMLLAEAKSVAGEEDSVRSLLLEAGELLHVDRYLTAMESSPITVKDSNDSLLEEMRSLNLGSTKQAKTKAILLSPSHSASCQCGPCSSPQHLFSTTLLLHSWARMLLGCDQPATSLSVLQDASQYCQQMTNKLAWLDSGTGVPVPTTCPVFFRLQVQNAHLMAEVLLALNQPSAVVKTASGVLSLVSRKPLFHEPVLRLGLARLHLTLAQASLAELWNRDPALATKLWEGPGQTLGRLVPSSQCRTYKPSGVDRSKPTRTRGKRGQPHSKAGREQPSRSSQQRTNRGEIKCTTENSWWLGSAPPSLHPILTHLLTGYQLCYPARPPQLLQDISQLLAMCVSPWDSLLAGHLLLSSCHTSLTHLALHWFGRKIR